MEDALMATATRPEFGTSETVPLQDVERELNRLCKAARGADEAPLVRAHMSNLVIYCTNAAAAAEIAAQAPDIVAVHPARVLLLINEPNGASEELTATVTAQVHPVGTGLRAFSELVTLRGDGPAGVHLPFAVRSLLIGDLPINLWWATPQPPALSGAILDDLAERADQVIYDSFGWPEPALGMTATATWLEDFERTREQGHPRVASDLTWRRLKYWRRLVAQALDPATAPVAAESVTEVLVEHGPHSVMTAWSLASWLTLRLGWTVRSVKVQPAVEINWHLTGGGEDRHMRIRRLGDGPRGIRRVRVACTVAGQAGAISMQPEGERRLSITPEGVPGAPRTITVPALPLSELVGRQLSDREPDPTFRRVMAVAQALAQSVLGGRR
jgi:glucose-6-phosphate dehydrogenase assembly protein OpcA